MQPWQRGVLGCKNLAIELKTGCNRAGRRHRWKQRGQSNQDFDCSLSLIRLRCCLLQSRTRSRWLAKIVNRSVLRERSFALLLSFAQERNQERARESERERGPSVHFMSPLPFSLGWENWDCWSEEKEMRVEDKERLSKNERMKWEQKEKESG